MDKGEIVEDALKTDFFGSPRSERAQKFLSKILIASLPRGQRQAATALGLTTAQGYRYVLLPMAFRIIMPPLTSEFLNTIKNTSVAITIGLIELTGRAREMQEFTFQVFEAFTAATVMYLAINIIVVTGMRFLERSLAIPGYITGK